MGQCDHVFNHVAHTPEVRNESEDFRGDPVDWGELIPPGPGQAEDLESILLKGAELKREM